MTTQSDKKSIFNTEFLSSERFDEGNNGGLVRKRGVTEVEKLEVL